MLISTSVLPASTIIHVAISRAAIAPGLIVSFGRVTN